MSSKSSIREPRHPIQVVARRTGLSSEVLRVWEKRYGVVEPARSAGGRRLYSDEDIERLRMLRLASLAGRRIGAIADLSKKELLALIEEDQAADEQARADEHAVKRVPPDSHVAECLEATEQLDEDRLETILNRLLVTLTIEDFLEGVIGPFMRSVGQGWADGAIAPYQEHFASSIVRRVLASILTRAPSNGERVLVVSTPQGQRHELGALMVAATAASDGWGVLYLGVDLPAEDIVNATRQPGVKAVALSILKPVDPTLVDEIRTIRSGLEKGVELIVGGDGAASLRTTLEEAGAAYLGNTLALRSFLYKLNK